MEADIGERKEYLTRLQCLFYCGRSPEFEYCQTRTQSRTQTTLKSICGYRLSLSENWVENPVLLGRLYIYQ
ncbi:hypothetical protein QT970_14285, partial [Microcoleus sp. herbarium8]|uniref:hypothetical protein n=1 Tax=Microcoleus sp. herbarium8 TaxID=3055436 RepID=UPI002FD706DA